jgi:hypothetical protein
MSRHSINHRFGLLLAGLSLCVACADDDRSVAIDDVRSGSPPRIEHGKGLSEADRLGLGGSGGHGGAPHAAPRTFECELPVGWKTVAPSRFRDLNFTLERDASAECYLTVMSGGGGGLELNVNRWRGQMKLGPIAPEEISSLPTASMFGRDASLVEMSGSFTGRGGAVQDNFGFCALFLELPGTTMTLKLTGPAAVVDQERTRFLQVARSLRVAPRATTTPSAPAGGQNGAIAAGMATGGAGFRWETPKGWTRGRDRSMRVVTLHPGGDTAMECYVSMMAGTGGGVDLNVNRWLGQVGASALPPKEVSKLVTVPMLGATGVLVESTGDFTGMAGGTKRGSGLLGVVCVLRDRAVFVKLVGPAKNVAEEKANFLSLCRSLERTQAGIHVEGK